MTTKVHGPLIEDYKRALKAAKWAGVKAVRVEIGETAIVLIMDDTYLEKLALGQPPAQELKGEGKLPEPNW
jgi:hypothetical protein